MIIFFSFSFSFFPFFFSFPPFFFFSFSLYFLLFSEVSSPTPYTVRRQGVHWSPRTPLPVRLVRTITRGARSNFFIQRSNCRSIKSIAPKIWNILSAELKMSPSIASFKERSKRDLLGGYGRLGP